MSIQDSASIVLNVNLNNQNSFITRFTDYGLDVGKLLPDECIVRNVQYQVQSTGSFPSPFGGNTIIISNDLQRYGNGQVASLSPTWNISTGAAYNVTVGTSSDPQTRVWLGGRAPAQFTTYISTNAQTGAATDIKALNIPGTLGMTLEFNRYKK